jgi:hypothetical protein
MYGSDLCALDSAKHSLDQNEKEERRENDEDPIFQIFNF